ncbi:hypothetical protein [Legionella impletisoli]|uniref:Uncharacterized protein n=1 Tax=Legionella impletisoli TaxID=343510 RepID=A0A917JQ42_9GAMM|nr:hypothetical protein [Legionella impletisoli]GGI78042.1 hypothetical protein GCM10007966_03400 [Legionella impletisoli]
MHRSADRFIWFFFITFLAIQILIEANSLIHHDIIWSLEIGKRMFSGGHYGSDFFETNPSLLYFIHGSLVLLAEAIPIKPITAFYSFLAGLTGLCYFISFKIIRNLFSIDETAGNYLLIALALSLGLATLADYGQKEQIMLLLSLPYFFLNLSFLLNKPRSAWLGGLVGAMAGIGFALKPPYFFIPFCLTELWLFWNKKSLSVFLRWDLAALALVQVVYLISFIIFTPTYLTEILPVILATYVPEHYVHINILLLQAPLLFFFISLIIWAFCYQKNRLNSIIQYLFMICLGFALSYLLQSKGWRYQALPLYATNILLVSLIGLSGFRKFKHARIERYLLIMTLFISSVSFYVVPIALNTKNQMQCAFNSQCAFNHMVNEVSYYAQNEPFFMFSTYMQSAYFMYYGHMKLGSRFCSLWPLPGLVNHPANPDMEYSLQQRILEDFKRFKPKLVLVNINVNNYEQYGYIHDSDFNFLTFMEKNKAFKQLWQEYHWVKRIQYNPLYSFDLYLKRS